MKTILFLSLMLPLSAFASYQCVSHEWPARGLGIHTQDPAHVRVFVDHDVFTAAVVADEPGTFASTTYDLKNGLDQLEGTLVVNKWPVLSITRGSSSCGRRSCSLHDDTAASTPVVAPIPAPGPEPEPTSKTLVTAVLTTSFYGPTEFECDEVTL